MKLFLVSLLASYAAANDYIYSIKVFNRYEPPDVCGAEMDVIADEIETRADRALLIFKVFPDWQFDTSYSGRRLMLDQREEEMAEFEAIMQGDMEEGDMEEGEEEGALVEAGGDRDLLRCGRRACRGCNMPRNLCFMFFNCGCRRRKLWFSLAVLSYYQMAFAKMKIESACTWGLKVLTWNPDISSQCKRALSRSVCQATLDYA